MIKQWLWGENPPYAIEPIATVPRRRLGSFLGLEWLGTPWWWVSPLWMLGAGLATSRITRPSATRRARLVGGLGYGLGIAGSVLWHQVGTLLSGRAMGAPMDADLLTATLPVNLYRSDAGRHYPSRVHLGRALGGPLANLLLGVALLGVRARGQRRPGVTFLAVLNVLFTVVSLAPLPAMDGGIVVRKLTAWHRE